MAENEMSIWPETMRVISWKEYVRSMPITRDQMISDHRSRLSRDLIVSPSSDIEQAERDINALMKLDSTQVSIQEPDLELGRCTYETVEGLIWNVADHPGPLISEAFEAYRGIRLRKMAHNARTAKPEDILIRPRSRIELTQEVRKLNSVPERSDYVDELQTFGWVLEAAAGSKDISEEDKIRLHCIQAVSNPIRQVSSGDWLLVKQLIERGSQFVALTRERNGLGHMDIVTDVDLERDTIRSWGKGERLIGEVQRKMNGDQPLTEFPPVELAGPDEAEIRIRMKLGAFR